MSRPAAQRSRRGCSSASSGAGNGSRLSQYGRCRSAGSAASRLCRCVVPVRGSPQMMIGRSIGMSAISRCSVTSACSRSRLIRLPTSCSNTTATPVSESPASGFAVRCRGFRGAPGTPGRRSQPGRCGRGRRRAAPPDRVAGWRRTRRGRRGSVGPLPGHRVGEVGEPDVGGTLAHFASPISTTRQCGRAGVSSGRNQRSQIRPLLRPAVDTQLGWPGSVWLTTIRQEPSGS